MRPLASVNTLAWDGSSAHCSSRSSTDTSPNSLTTMAKRCSCSAARRLASRVVLPDPRKPVKMVTGSLGTVSLLLTVHISEDAYSANCSQSVQGFDQEGIDDCSGPESSPFRAAVGETRHLHALAQLGFALHCADEASGQANHQLWAPSFCLNESKRLIDRRWVIA